MNAIGHDLFGFEKTPFLTACKKPFLDVPRQKCLEQLNTFLHYRGFAAIAGEPGTGKTTLVGELVKKLNPSANKVIYIPFANFSESDLLRYIATCFGLEPAFRKSKAVADLQDFIKKLQAIDPIIVFDDAQNASPKTLESIRLLANDGFDARKSLSCIMI